MDAYQCNGQIEASCTFNPGWDSNAQKLASFTDVRELQRQLKAQGVELQPQADETTTGPAYFIAVDPDGNPMLGAQQRLSWMARADRAYGAGHSGWQFIRAGAHRAGALNPVCDGLAAKISEKATILTAPSPRRFGTVAAVASASAPARTTPTSINR